MPGIVQRLRLVLDTQAADQLKHDVGNLAGGAVDQIAAAFRDPKVPQVARDAGLAAIKALEETFRTKTLELQQLVAQGLLTPAAARRQGKLAADEFTAGLKQTLDQGKALAGVNAPIGLNLKSIRDGLRNLFDGGFAAVPKATEKVGLLSRGLGFLKTQVLSLVAPLAAFFTARELISFGKDSIAEFEKDSKAINDLRVNVERAGESFDALAPRIETVNAAFQRTGRLSGGDFNATLSQLIGISKDVENSLKNVGLVTDFAAKHNLSLQQATDLVGKAMVGNARGLREFGIEAKVGDDAILLLRKDSQGFVDQQGPTFAKAVNALSFAWGDLKSAVGEALVEAGGGTSILDTFSGAIQAMTRWVKENKGELRGWITDGLKAVQETIRSTTVDVLRLQQFGKLVSASFDDLDESTTRLNASYLTLQAAFLDVAGFTAAAKASRDAAADLRKQADAVRDLAAAKREDARALGEEARTVGRPPSTTAPTTWHGGPSRIETVPTGGRATVLVHTPGGGDTDTLTKRISLLTRATQVEALRAQALEALGKIETDLERQLTATNLPLEKRILLEDHLNAVQRARGTLPLERLAPADQLGVLSRTIQLTDLRAESLTHLGRLEELFTLQLNDGTKSLEFRAAAEDNLRKVQDLRGNQPFDTLPLEQRVKLLTQATEIEQFRAGALDGLAKAEAEVRAELDSGTLALGRRIEKTAELQAIQGALGARKVDDLPLQEQITLFQQGLGATETFASSLRGLQEAEGRLEAEVAAAEPGTVRRLQLEQQLYDLRATLGAQSLETQIALLATALKSDETRAEAIRELIVLERQLATLQQDPHRTPAARAATAQAQGAVQEALGTAPAREVAATRAQGNLTQAEGQTVIISPKLNKEALATIDVQTETMHDKLAHIGDELPPIVLPFDEDVITTAFDNIHTIATDVAGNILQVFSDTFSHLADGSVSLGKSFLNLGKGIAHSILAELAKLAGGKVVENIANAIEEKARAAAAAATGNFAGAAAHSAAAVSFLHAAASWGAVALVAGAGAAATASGGGGGSGGASPDRSAEGNDPLKNGRQKAELIIYGGVLDTDNTAQMDALAKGISYLGDRDIVVRRA